MRDVPTWVELYRGCDRARAMFAWVSERGVWCCGVYEMPRRLISVACERDCVHALRGWILYATLNQRSCTSCPSKPAILHLHILNLPPCKF